MSKPGRRRRTREQRIQARDDRSSLVYVQRLQKKAVAEKMAENIAEMTRADEEKK